jgi:hypothetical protein
MFLTELSPLLRECLAQPLGFVGGLVTGALRLNLQDEPVKTWLAQQGAVATPPPPYPENGSGPQSIAID